jgi:hypothetical protein
LVACGAHFALKRPQHDLPACPAAIVSPSALFPHPLIRVDSTEAE